MAKKTVCNYPQNTLDDYSPTLLLYSLIALRNIIDTYGLTLILIMPLLIQSTCLLFARPDQIVVDYYRIPLVLFYLSTILLIYLVRKNSLYYI